jgi:DNA processing protein
MVDREYLAALYSFTYFGPARTKLLLSYYKSAKNAWNASATSLIELGLKEHVVNDFVKYRNSFMNSDYFNRLKTHSISFLTLYDDNYPKNLKEIDSAPVILYYIGEIKAFTSNAIAIVGSRQASYYGREVASKISSQLASYGITIISGLALGIDAVAHKACLDAGGRGVAVLASGLDTITPLTNRHIAIEIVKKGGAIVSEYPLGYPPFRTSFPSRNRIISGLSKGVVVIEGLSKSGTLLTASAAANQGRPVFAVPGQITSPLSAAPHFLIKNGAKLVSDVSDILDELDLQLKVNKEEVEKIMPTDILEDKILKIIENEDLHVDEICRILGLQVSNVSGKLTIMELKGMIKNVGNGIYAKRV